MALEKIGVEATIQGLSSFRRGIGQMDDDVRGFGRSAGSIVPSLDSMGSSLLNIGAVAAGAVVAGLAAATTAAVAFAGSGIKAAIDMEDQMGNIAAIMNTTKAEIQPLADLILDLGIDPGLKVTAEEAANAIELLARNGLSMSEIMEGAARNTILLANATGSEFGNAADIATDAMAIFGIQAKDMQGAVDAIVSVTTNSKFSIDDFSLALRNGGASAAQLGVSLEDFNTVIAASAEEMGSGMRAGTGFRNFLTRLTPNSDKAADAMRELGLITASGSNAFFDANGQLKDMAEVSGILQNALFGTSTVMTEVGGRTAAQNEELSRLQKIYNRTALSIRDYTTGVKGASLSDEARANKLEDLNLQLANTQAQMDPLLAIQGDFIESTKTLTDAERSAFLETIFGQDALGTAIALANEGEESFRELAASMSETDAAAAALERMDSVAGVMEIISSVIDGLKLQIGQAFLPLVRDLADNFLVFVQNVGPLVVAAFEDIANGIAAFVDAIRDGEGLMDAFFGALEAAGLESDILVPMRQITEQIKSFIETVVEFVSEHADEFKGALAGIGAVLASGVIVSVLGTIAGIVGALISPIGLLVIGFAALGAAIAHFGGIQQILENIRTFIETTDFAALGQQIIQKILEGASQLGAQFGVWAGNVLVQITEAINSIDWTTIGQQVMTFIGDAIAAYIGFQILIGQTIYNFFNAGLASQDWLTIGTNILTVIFNALSSFGEGVGIVLAGWYESFVVWVQSVDWGAIGLSILNFIVNGLASFGALIGQTLTGWYTSFTAWLDSINWAQLGANIVVFILNGIKSSFALTIQTWSEWANAFFDWMETVDWEKVGHDLVVLIVAGLVGAQVMIIKTLAEWTDLFIAWVKDTDWEAVIADAIIRMVTELETFARKAISVLVTFYVAIRDWFNSQDWGVMGQSIIDGLVGALQKGGGAVIGALRGIVTGAINAAKEAAGIQSPSKVFFEIGLNIGQGLILGIDKTAESVHDSILALFDIGGDLGSIGSGFANQLKNNVLPQMEDAIENADRTIGVLKERFVGTFGSVLGITSGEEVTQQKLISAYFKAIHEGNTQMERDVKNIWRAQNELGVATFEYKKAQEDIAALQKAQADLSFLKQQQDLLGLISEHGLNAADILGGLQLGLEADTQGLVQAMTRAIQAIIQQAQEQLGVASPSKVFKQIGEFVTSGLAQGIMATISNPAMAMESMLNQMVQPMQSQAAMPSVINQPSTTTISKTANVQFGDVSVSDNMDLQVIGDFLVQRVAAAL